MSILKGFLAIISGIIIGGLVNAGLILIFNAIFGAPEGMNIFDAESVKAHANELSTANFIGTLLAHQLGTLVGAFVAAKIAPVKKMIFAGGIGVWFLLGGIYAITLIPAPTWFILVDLLLYIPFAIIGGKLATGQKIMT